MYISAISFINLPLLEIVANKGEAGGLIKSDLAFNTLDVQI